MPDNTPSASQLLSRLEAVLAEIIQAEEQGHAIDVQRYVDSFPELAGPLRDYFQDRERFARLVATGAIQPPPSELETKEQSGAATNGSRLAGYEIEAELGRGGMGIVYRARQLNAERLVALKVIRMDRLRSLTVEERQQWLERFRREAQLVASLDRPDHIVTLHEIGEHEGQPYFTMRLVTGGTLAQRLKQPADRDAAAVAEQRVCGQRENARLLGAVARAVHYAHQRGILHRDLKPANILLDEQGRPLVSDFGLARRLDQTGSLVAGGVEGTASYMSPEQATGVPGATTTASDVYSLGAILYEMLTGQPPFKGKTDVETLLMVLHKEPVPPRSLNRRLHRDLETICLKCLQKEPGRRYASAATLADDLDNWLLGRPIHARPAGAAERLWRWCRRNPVPATAAAAIAATVVLAFVLISLSRDKAVQLAETNGKLAQEMRELAEKETKLARERAREATSLRLDRGVRSGEEGNPDVALLWLGRALATCPKEDVELREVIRRNLAGWRQTLPALRPPLGLPGVAGAVGFSRDGRKLWALSTGSLHREERTWPDGVKRPTLVFRPETLGDDFLQGRVFDPLPTAGSLMNPPPRRPSSPRGQLLLFDTVTGEPVTTPLPEDQQVLAVDPHAETALTIQKQDNRQFQSSLRLWNLATSKPVGPPIDLNDRVRLAVFSPDGKFFVTSGMGMTALWESATGKFVTDFGRDGDLYTLTFSQDGKILALVTADAEEMRKLNNPLVPLAGLKSSARLQLYDISQRKELPVPFPLNLDAATPVAVAPGGETILYGVREQYGLGTSGRLVDPRTWKERGRLELEGVVVSAVFSPDGKALLTACRAGTGLAETVQLWDAKTGRPIGPPLMHRGSLWAAAFSADGRLLATAGGQQPPGRVQFLDNAWDGKSAITTRTGGAGEVQLWDVATGKVVGRPFRHEMSVLAVAVSPDGQTILTGGRDGAVRRWDVQAVRPPHPLRRLKDVAAVSPDGARALVRVNRGQLRLHDTASGFPCGELVPWTDRDREVLLSPDVCTVLIAQKGKTARLWNAVTGKPIGAELQDLGIVVEMRFSPTGRTVITGSAHGANRIGGLETRWDATTGRQLPFSGPQFAGAALRALSADDRYGLWSYTSTSQILDVATRQVVGKPLIHNGRLATGLFSPNGRTLLTVGSPTGLWQEARIHVVATGEPIGQPLQHQGLIRCLAYSPDSKRIATGSDDHTARVWDAETGKPVGPPLSHKGPIRAIAFSPDGTLLATGGEDGAVQVWHAELGKPLGPPFPHAAPVSFVAWRPQGDTVVTRSGDGDVGVWELHAGMKDKARDILLWTQVRTGMDLDGDVPRLLNDDELARRAQQLKQRAVEGQ